MSLFFKWLRTNQLYKINYNTNILYQSLYEDWFLKQEGSVWLSIFVLI